MAASNIVQIVIQAVDSASNVFKAIGDNSDKMGTSVSAAMNKSAKEIAKAQTALIGLKDNLASTIGSFKGLVADFGMIGIGASIAKTAENWAESVYNLRRAIGGTAEDASQLLAIGKYAGISTEEAAMYFAKFGKAISTAKDEMQKAATEGKRSNDVFTRLGISFDQINNKNVGEVFALIADKMRNMADGADKDRIAMKLFGRSGFQVTEMLNLSKDQIAAVTEKARESGLILDNETTEGWHKLGLEAKVVGGVLQGLTIQIGNELLPALKGQLDAITNLIGAHRNLSPEMQKVIGYGIQAIGMFGEYRLAAMAISALAPALGAALTGPWGLAAAAIGIATAKVLQYIETLHKVPSYNDKAEVREIGDDGMGHMLYQKKQQINTFMGIPIYDWVDLSSEETEAQRNFAQGQALRSLKGDSPEMTDQQYAAAKAETLQIETPTTFAPPVVGGGKRASEDKAAERLERANERAAQMMADLDRRIMEESSTAYQAGMAKITAEVTKMQNEVQQIGKDGGDTSGLADKIAKYQQVAADKVKETWRQAWIDVTNQTALIGAQLIGDKKAQADIEYQIELDKIEKERKARLKAIQVDGNDTVALDAANREADAKKQAAGQKRDQAYTDASLQKYQNALQYDAILINLEGKTQQQVDALRQKDLASEISYLQQAVQAVGITDQQRLSLQEKLNEALNQKYQLDAYNREAAASVAMRDIQSKQMNYAQLMVQTYDQIYDSFAENINKMLAGTESLSKGIRSIISSMAQDVEEMLVKMWVNQTLAGPLQQLFGGVIGTGLKPTLVNASGAITSGGQNIGMGGLTNMNHYADGGDYPGGLALVGEEGPELINFKAPGYVYTANQTQQLLNHSSIPHGSPTIITMNIQTPNAQSFHQSRSQVLAGLYAAMAAGRRNL